MKSFHAPELLDNTPEVLPARVLLQVREGIPNLMIEGTLRSFQAADPSAEDAALGAKITHTIPTGDTVKILGHALEDHIQDWRKTAPADELANVDAWLRQLRDWIFRDTA